MKSFYLTLAALFGVVWLWSGYHAVYPHDWLLENYLVFFFLPVILLTFFYFRLSRVSYGLVTIFMCLHVIGSHYTYSEVPFGYTLQRWLGADRNMYDRLVHFSFGLLLAYPLREMLLRVARVKGIWGYYLPLDIALAFSAIYELIEWFAARNVDPKAGLAFLGSQGDIWDAQKDMAIAGLGALIAMVVTALINWALNPNFKREMRESFRRQKGDHPLGEEKIQEWIGGKP